MNPSDADDTATVDVDWIATHIGDPNVRLVEVDVSAAAYNQGHSPGRSSGTPTRICAIRATDP
jgi:3-mercaptopyruvate sulfurtransferase SseA